MEEGGVIVLPGAGFGAGGEGFFRVCPSSRRREWPKRRSGPVACSRRCRPSRARKLW